MRQRTIAAVFLASMATIGVAQTQQPRVLMLSDIHLDPYHDPAKFHQLEKAPVTEWQAIFATPSASQASDFDELQRKCKAKGVDTPPELFEAALAAAHEQVARPAFITVSGDLMAHKFDCRYQQLSVSANSAEYAVFAAKTVAYVALRIHEEFPTTPVYTALGNNDSGCTDYAETENSAFLRADARPIAADTLNRANEAAVRESFPVQGDYSVLLPAPMSRTRLIVLQDIFESREYAACGHKADVTTERAETTKQIAWLRRELDRVKANGEHAWVMAHIPPGVDAYSTFKNARNVCGGDDPVLFLSSDAFAATLGEYSGTVSLALFGHTHMDEMRLYSGEHGAVPGKLVPSVSPVNGNLPAFTVATLDAAQTGLKDYTVYAAADAQGSSWAAEYTYAATYHQPDFTATSVAKLMQSFAADKANATPEVQAYEKQYFIGLPAEGMKGAAKANALAAVWPAYVCSVTQPTTAGFRGCMCKDSGK